MRSVTAPHTDPVIPAQAGIQAPKLGNCGTIRAWIPAFAGMTNGG